MSQEHTSRRRFLAAAGATVAGATAGCSGLLGRSDSGPQGTAGQPSGTDGPPNSSGTPAGPPDERAAASFRGGLKRQGYQPEATIPTSVEQAWRVEGINKGDHTASKASAVQAPTGDIVVPGDSGVVHAIRPDGTVKWVAATHPSAFGIHGTPAIANDTVYIGAYDGAIYAFALETGDLRWRTKLGGSIGGSPAYYDGTLYVPVEFPDPDGSLFAVDAASGSIQAEKTRPTDHPHSTPGIDLETGTITMGSNDGFLYAWSFPDLEPAWEFDAGRAIKEPIAVYDGAAIFGSWSDHVYQVDLATGEEDWRFQTGDFVMSGASVDTDAGTVFVGSHDTNLYALDAATGEERWRFGTGDIITGCPVVTAEHVVCGSYDSFIYALEKESGDQVWSVDNPGWITCEPLVTEEGVYYTEAATDDTSGGVYRLVGN